MRNKKTDATQEELLQLKVEKMAREQTNSYLKWLSGFVLVVLLAAGYSGFNIVSDYKKDVDEVKTALKDQINDLKQQQGSLQQSQAQLQYLISQTQRDATDVEKASLTVQQEGAKAANAERSASQANQAASGTLQRANEALKQADMAGEKTEAESKRAADASKEIESAKADVQAKAKTVTDTSEELKTQLATQVQLAINREKTQVLVRGRRTSCVELANLIKAKTGGEPGFELRNTPEPFFVRFKVVHIHVHPVNLRMEVLKSCDEYAKGPTYMYTLPKKESSEDEAHKSHPIPTTPFAFHMDFIYDPVFTYDFVILGISPDTKLLEQGPPYAPSDLYDDTKRSEEKASAALSPDSLDFADSPGSEVAGVWKRAFGPGAVSKSVFLASFDQAIDHHADWGQGTEGYMKRFGSRYGSNAITHTLEFSIGSLRGEGQRYYPSTDTGIKARTLQRLVLHHVQSRRRWQRYSGGVAACRRLRSGCDKQHLVSRRRTRFRQHRGGRHPGAGDEGGAERPERVRARHSKDLRQALCEGGAVAEFLRRGNGRCRAPLISKERG
jgi:hypothetical protein